MTEPRTDIQPRPAAAITATPQAPRPAYIKVDGRLVLHHEVAYRLIPIQVVDFYAAAQDTPEARRGL